MSSRLRYLSTTLALVAIDLGYAPVQGWSAWPAPSLAGPALVTEMLSKSQQRTIALQTSPQQGGGVR
jgi:hypothetical protein